MSWQNTYSHNFLIGLDSFAACIIFNRSDLTISTLCRLRQAQDEYLAKGFGKSTSTMQQLADAETALLSARYRMIPLHGWQQWTLGWLWKVLNFIQKDHCELARIGDLERADSMDALLRVPADPKLREP